MPALPVTPLMEQFVDDELLRAPLLFDQVMEGALLRLRRTLPTLSAFERTTSHDLVQMVQARPGLLAEQFTRSLREQVAAELANRQTHAASPSARNIRPACLPLALVDEAEVAIDVELAHTIECIKSAAEYEVRELQTYTAALVGDMEMAHDHNPFRAETFARALWAAAYSLPLSRQQQTLFMHHAAEPLAAVLRQAYAASSSRLESMGVEPAAYRTLVRSGGSRRDRLGETSFSPLLKRVRTTLPAAGPHLTMTPVPSRFEDQPAPVRAAPPAPGRSARQAQELVGRLFGAIRNDKRVPTDVLAIILKLHGPALQLAAHETEQVAEDAHPLWTFINRLAYEAAMTPDAADPERVRLLRLGLATIQQLAGEPEQRSSLYAWAVERLDVFLNQRLARRCTAAASQIGALQKLEDRLMAGQMPPTSLHGALDVPQLDTVPAALMEQAARDPAPGSVSDDEWLDGLRPGVWVRLFLQGHWIQAQLLWPGERREIWLFGDGASDATWVVRRRALLKLKQAQLLKQLTRRSLVRRAARQVHDDILAAAA